MPVLPPAPAAGPPPSGPPLPGRWHGDGLIARSVRFALTLMGPIAVALVAGVNVWLVYAMVTCILAFTLDTGGPARARLTVLTAAGVVVLAGTGLGTLVAGHVGLVALAFAGVGALYALVESLHPSAAAASRFACLTLAVGALYAPLQALDVAVVAGAVLYAWLVSLAWDVAAGEWRPSTAPDPALIYARLRATERQRWIFAGAVAIAVPLAFLVSLALGLHRPYWALIAVVLVLRADLLASRRQMVQMILGTLIGVVAAFAYGALLPSHMAVLAGMMVAALLRWPAQQYNDALGTGALTAFIMLLLEFVAGGIAGAAHDIIERLVDVVVGCSFAVVALGLDRLGQRLFARRA